jgi:hypothetical protein
MSDIYRFTPGPRNMMLIYAKLFLARMGALMGGGVGLTIGFIFGSYSILRYAPCFPPSPTLISSMRAHASVKRGGAGPRGFLATLSQYMLSSAATFSFFLAIGSVRLRFLHPLPPSALSVTLRFTSPSFEYHFTSRVFMAYALPRLFETTPSCHRILKPRGFSCFLL